MCSSDLPPRTLLQRFEIGLVVVPTQNTTWKSAVKALLALRETGELTPDRILAIDEGQLQELIRPARYPVSKSRYLREMAAFFREYPFRKQGPPDRKTLLAIPGIGPESADSLLLYAFGQPCFIADAYGRRILAALGLVPETAGYEPVREWAEGALPRDSALLGELHALLVAHGTRFYSRRPYGEGDTLLEPLSR